MKRLFGAAAFATMIALSPACGRDQPKATFNNRAPIVDTEKGVKMADEKPAEKKLDQIVPKKAEDAGVKKEKPVLKFQSLEMPPIPKLKRSEPEPRIH